MSKYQSGQEVEVRRTLGYRGQGQSLIRSWRPGYRVVADPSPYRDDCILVVLPGSMGVFDNVPFNVEPADVRTPLPN